MSEPIDLLITARWLIPVQPENSVLEHCCVAVHQGDIIAILPQREAEARYRADKTVDLPNHALIPGLVNAHGHLAMSLLRGYADDFRLQEWLQQHIWPAEGRWVGEDFVQDGSELAMAEMIRSGTTCFADMYFFPNLVAELAVRTGLRGQIAFPIINFPTAWARNAEEYLHKGIELYDRYKRHDLVRIAFGPHAPYTVDDATMQKIAVYAGELDACIQIHLHETPGEIEDALRETGRRPIDRLHDLGLLSPLTQCVHMTQITDGDIRLLVETNAHVVHCPESNLKLASGSCPVARLKASGINVALGTDGAASNNDLNLFGEMRTAALIGKALAGDAAVLNAHEVLRMATLDGARALGWQHRIGSIEAGKAADLVAVDLSGLEHQPLYNPVSQLIYCDTAHRVSHVWVEGKPLLENRQLTGLNEHELATKARQWRDRIG